MSRSRPWPPVVMIRPEPGSVALARNPRTSPSFDLFSTVTNLSLEVELATEASLFDAVNNGRRRTDANFFNSSKGRSAAPPVKGISIRSTKGLRSTPSGSASLPAAIVSYRIPPPVWSALFSTLGTNTRLYYRLVARSSGRVVYSTKDTDWRSAPFVHVLDRGLRLLYQPLRPALSGQMKWMRVSGNAVVTGRRSRPSAAGRPPRPLLLRGVNMPGLQHRQPNWSTQEKPAPRPGLATGTRKCPVAVGANTCPTGHVYDAADITHLRLREVSKQWGANVIRLPINQEWALDGVMDSKTGTLVQSAADYLSDIDCVVGWAATEHMYLLLSLQTLKPGYNAPMPDNRSIVLWRLLASRFRREPGVLFDLLNEPHQPSPHDRYPYVGPKPQTDSGWVDLWHEWVRVLEAVIHDVHPDALIFVSGIGGPAWASDLSSFPVVPRTPVGTSSLPNAVYSAHFYPHGALRSGGARLFDRLLGYTDAAGKARPLPLPANHPVFLGEFGPKESVDDVIDVTQSPPQPVPTWTAEQRWLCSLLRYIRALHAPHYRGLVGWTAWSWADAPRLVRRLGGKRGTGGCAQDNPFMADSSGNRVPTSFGQIVKEELAQKGGAMGPTCR